jgi:hypothetical protein
MLHDIQAPSGTPPTYHVDRAYVRFGSKADICAANGDIRFTLYSDRKSGYPHKVMSALPPKADMCSATRDVRFGPKADSCSAAKISLFDHLVGKPKKGFLYF